VAAIAAHLIDGKALGGLHEGRQAHDVLLFGW
jgi:hypothetical protein